MSSRRQLVFWLAAALVGLGLLGGVLRWERHYVRTRWANFLVGDPHQGRHLFREKNCARCHAVNGVGGRLAPDLGFEQVPQSNLSELAIAMWNHAPRMWERMRAEKVAYPELGFEEMAHLFAYLYTARYVDEPGDAYRGKQLFETKGCIRCHAVHGNGGGRGPDLAPFGYLMTPIAWTQAMWNHAPAMEAEFRKRGLPWPTFQGGEMNDLLAYLRELSAGPRREFELLPADPDRGWRLFQSKSCMACHAVKGEGGRVGPELGPGQELPLTIVQFAGLMWNHSPEMWREMKARGIARPTFTGREMADLIAFLHSVRYFESGGSPQMGRVLVARRGCGDCHGPDAGGSTLGPTLRGRGETYTSVTLAAALWRHGLKMYERTQQLGDPWPALAEDDFGDLVVFLNTPPTEKASDTRSSSSLTTPEER